MRLDLAKLMTGEFLCCPRTDFPTYWKSFPSRRHAYCAGLGKTCIGSLSFSVLCVCFLLKPDTPVVESELDLDRKNPFETSYLPVNILRESPIFDPKSCGTGTRGLYVRGLGVGLTATLSLIPLSAFPIGAWTGLRSLVLSREL